MEKRHLLYIFLAISPLCLFTLSRPPRNPISKYSNYQFESLKEEQAFVNSWYAATNATYFSDKLPKDTAIEIHAIPPDSEAQYTIGQVTPLGNGEYIIELDPRFNQSGNQEAMTIDHEMCHIYLDQQNGDGDSNHGPRFQACMQRLAAQQAFNDLW